MSDDADVAQFNMENEESLRKKYSNKPTLEAEPVGKCLNCGVPLQKNRRWCDTDCRHDWNLRKNK